MATKHFYLPDFRGGPRDLLTSHEHEVICVGPSDTGKTWAACVKSFMLCTDKKRPGVKGAMMRKTFHSIFDSVVRTFDKITAGMPIRRYGGQLYRDRYVFPNKSEIVCIGLDKPDKLLSSEWDFIQVCQTEELLEADWEMIASRCTGRGAVVAFPQIFGDCNPGSSRHWIRQRAEKGALRLINAYHKDNLALYDKAGNITEEGKRRIGFLESTLTGLRRQRLLLGKWATAEGAVFDTFDPENVHVCVRSESEMKTWHLCMDEGFTNPAVILLCGDDSDGRRHVFREYYQRGALQADVIQAAVKLFKDFQCYMIAVDAAAAGLIAGLNGCGVNAVGGKGRIIDGIYALQNRLLVCRDGRPRLTIDPSCKETINEFESHVWQPDKPKDVPIDRDNHSIAALRYLEDVLAVPTGAVDSADNLYTGESEFAGEEIEFGQRLELR